MADKMADFAADASPVKQASVASSKKFLFMLLLSL